MISQSLAAFISIFAVLSISGDKKPESWKAMQQLTRDNMEIFNLTCKDYPDVYCQSYAVVMKENHHDIVGYSKVIKSDLFEVRALSNSISSLTR